MTAGRLLPRGPAIAGPVGLDRSTRLGLGRAAAGSLAVAAACVGGMLVLRRLTGGFAMTPGPGVAWAVAIAGGLLMLATDQAARLGEEAWPRWLARGGFALAALAVVPLGDELPWPARMLGLAGVALSLLIAMPGLPALRRPPGLGPGWRRGGTRGVEAAANPEVVIEAGIGPAIAPAVVPGQTSPGAQLGQWRTTLEAGFRQRLERFEAADGADCLRGQVMLTVPAGSRIGHAHVGFCPPFNALPVVEVSTECDFVEAAVSAAEILPWGVRVECRLSEPAEESLEIPVDLLARHPA